MDAVTLALIKSMAGNGGGGGGSNKFIVTLTPTSLDYSGTMDKTASEINAAYEAGMDIVFRVMNSATEHIDVNCTAVYSDDSTYPSFEAYIVTGGLLMFAYTGTVNNPDWNTYSTNIYSLTPAS